MLAGRSNDMFDIGSENIVKSLDFIKLDELVQTILPDLLNDRVRNEFVYIYSEYCKKYRKE